MSNSVERLTLDQARRIVLKAQGLYGCEPSLTTPMAVIERLGYLQIDTIAVVRRAHHHVLWTRYPCDTEAVLHRLQSRERQIFEYWGHAMSYLPMKHYRFFLPRMINFRNPTSPWAKDQHEKAASILEDVLARIREEGPLAARDFKSHRPNGGTWWDWKPAKVALELLYWRGDLMITERRQFQKVYDLTERVLPSEIVTAMPSEEEVARFLIGCALKAMGVATEREILKFMQPDSVRDSDWQAVPRSVMKAVLHQMTGDGELITVQIEGQAATPNYALPQTLADYKDVPSTSLEKRLVLLSPFDNLIIQRDRLKRFFGFEYRMECYVPEAKRKFGYFVLPLLWGTQFIGRMDAKAERKTGTLLIKRLDFELGTDPGDGFPQVFAEAVTAFARFNRCDKVWLHDVTPASMKVKLTLALAPLT